MDSKKMSFKLYANYTINYLFYLYLIFYICIVKFDMTENLEYFVKYFEK